MRKALKIATIAVAVLVVAVAVLALAAGWLAERKRTRTIELDGRARRVRVRTRRRSSAASISTNRAAAWNATARTAPDGKSSTTGGAMYIKSPNISPGPGSVVTGYTEADWVRTIRHGVSAKKHPMTLMPSRDYSRMTDRGLRRSGRVRAEPAAGGRRDRR